MSMVKPVVKTLQKVFEHVRNGSQGYAGTYLCIMPLAQSFIIIIIKIYTLIMRQFYKKYGQMRIQQYTDINNNLNRFKRVITLKITSTIVKIKQQK